MARISIVTMGHFSNNPRVWREADALSKHHEVTVIGVWSDPLQSSLDQQMLRSRNWRFVPAADLRGSRWRSRAAALRRRLGAALSSRIVFDPAALSLSIHRMDATSEAISSDLLIGHLETGLWIAARALRHGRRVAFDFEDWHSENHPDAQHRTPLVQTLRRLEGEVWRGASYVSTTSHAMSRALAEEHGLRPAVVVYNANPQPSPLVQPEPSSMLRMVWFSQTIGPGRGLELLFDALRRVEGAWHLELRGAVHSWHAEWLQQSVAELHHRISIEPLVPPDQLTSTIVSHDVGLALDVPHCRNRDVTITNKTFEYAQGGLLTISTRTAGHLEAAKELPGAFIVLERNEPAELAGAIQHCIDDVAAIREARPVIQAGAERKFGYAQSAERLLRAVEESLARDSN